MVSEEDFRAFYAIALGIRRSFDPFPFPRRIIDSKKLKVVALELESIRIDLQFARDADSQQRLECLRDVRGKLKALLLDKEFAEIATKRRFRTVVPPDREHIFEELRDRDMLVSDAIDVFFQRLSKVEGEYTDNTDGSAALRKVVPDQKLAPAMFDIVNHKLVIINQVNKQDKEDERNIRNAFEALLNQGKNILEALQCSNCDRRILQRIHELQDKLSKKNNIIELGLMTLGVDRICKNASGELPEALSGAIEGHIAGIGMYVAQHAEWRRFSENAANVELDSGDVERISEAARAIIEGLEQNPEIADPEVPKTLRALSVLLKDPKLASRRAAFAVLRTVENLIAKVYHHGADFIDKTTTKTIDGLSSATSKVIVGTLIALAITATTNLGGLASGKIAESAWMKSAAEIVMKQLEKLGNE